MMKTTFLAALVAMLTCGLHATHGLAMAQERGLVIGSTWQSLDMDFVVAIDPSFLYVGTEILSEANSVRQYWFWKKGDRVAYTSVWAATRKAAPLNSADVLAGAPLEAALWSEANKAGTYKGLNERLAGLLNKQGLQQARGCYIIHCELDATDSRTIYVSTGLRRPIDCDYTGWQSIHREFKEIFAFSHRRHQTP